MSTPRHHRRLAAALRDRQDTLTRTLNGTEPCIGHWDLWDSIVPAEAAIAEEWCRTCHAQPVCAQAGTREKAGTWGGIQRGRKGKP